MVAKRTLALGGLTVVGSAVALPALAAWMIGGSGNGGATALVLGAPVDGGVVVTSGQGATITVSTGPGAPGATGYRVDRTSPSSAIGVCTIVGAAGSCPDPGATAYDATYSYAINSTRAGWVGPTPLAVSNSSGASPSPSPSPSPTSGSGGGATTVAAPTAVSLTGVAGTGGIYVNSTNRTAITLSATVSSTLAGDRIKWTITSSGGGQAFTAESALQPLSTTSRVVTLAAQNLTALSDGDLVVKAEVVRTGATGAQASNTSYKKDVVAPSSPAGVAGTVPENKSARIAWTVVSGVSYECNYDAVAFTACTSPKVWGPSNTFNGQHSYGVRAVDPAGNASAASTVQVTA